MILERKNIGSLITEKRKFIIPDYQRGYKWTRLEVLKLMNDIWDFWLNHKENSKDFYCLQPIVVKPNNDFLCVIDGQQRLTTFLIIQQAIKDYGILKNPNFNDLPIESQNILLKALSPEETYHIKYSTRGESTIWLPQRRNEEFMQVNSDYSHIYTAYNTCLEFLNWIDKDNAPTLLDKKYCPENKRKTQAYTDFNKCIKNLCYVIWYELDASTTNDHEIFDKLNTGKIPLTNAELIKALFLQENNFPTIDTESQLKSEDYRTSIARRWDDIEKKLQNPIFWNFIYDFKTVGMRYETRIEYLFDLLANKVKYDSDNFYFTFDYYDAIFQKYQEEGKSRIQFVDEQWKRVWELIQTMQDWYDNKEYYHYIGFLISQGTSVNDIKNIQFPIDPNNGEALQIPTKTQFLSSLKELIRNYTSNYKNTDLFKGAKGLTPTLLLFNVLCVLDNSDDTDRFPFHYYKNITWNQEHVAPDTPFDPNDPKRSFQFAAQMLEYYTDISYFDEIEIKTKIEAKKAKHERKRPEQIKNEVIKSISTKYEKAIEKLDEEKDICKNLLDVFKASGKENEEKIKKVFNDILTKLSIRDVSLNEEDNRRDFIWNQVLLDEGTNKSYGNAIFPYKRMRIIKNTTRGIFVPIGTYNVFVKAYSRRMTNMLEWDEKDALRYLSEIHKVLNRNGRNFLNKILLHQDNLPEYISSNDINQLINDELK